MNRAVMTLTELEDWAGNMARTAPPGAVVWLSGPLGAGKTTFAKAFAAGRGAVGEMASPTYSLVHRYDGPRGAVRHLDCYRLRSPEEAEDLAWDEIADSDAVLIEWPDRAGPWALPPTISIFLSHRDDESRQVEWTG